MVVDTDKVIRVHGIDPEQWAERYDILPFTGDCPGQCGRTVTTSIPFAFRESRGLVAQQCECGARPPYCIVNWENLYAEGE